MRVTVGAIRALFGLHQPSVAGGVGRAHGHQAPGRAATARRSAIRRAQGCGAGSAGCRQTGSTSSPSPKCARPRTGPRGAVPRRSCWIAVACGRRDFGPANSMLGTDNHRDARRTPVRRQSSRWRSIGCPAIGCAALGKAPISCCVPSPAARITALAVDRSAASKGLSEMTVLSYPGSGGRVKRSTRNFDVHRLHALVTLDAASEGSWAFSW